MKDRVILHCDMNSFFASVELLRLPELKDKPVAVCGSPDKRHGVILAKNELAKKYGVLTAETVWQALRKCPDLQLVPPHMSKYKHYSKEINKIYLRFTDMVEPFSIDESWLDVTNSQKLFGPGIVIANQIRKTVKEELGLTLSAGVSYNKVFAKMGSEYKKPDATTYITRDNFKTLLWPLPVSQLFFVGKSTSNKLLGLGIQSIGDLANANIKILSKHFGKHGELIWNYANGLDESPVSLYSHLDQIKSVGNGLTFTRDLITEDDIVTAVKALSDTVASRLRKSCLKAFGVKVDIKDIGLKTISRQKKLNASTNLASEISKISMDIIRANWKIGIPIRLITITAINLTDEEGYQQLSLFPEENVIHEKGEKVERTMDQIRSRFGDDAVGFATVLHNDIGAYMRKDTEGEEKEGEIL